MRRFTIKKYDLLIIILAIISITFVLLDFISVLNLNESPYSEIDNFILLVFTIDYVVRFVKAENKWHFFKLNIFDLIAIIPFNSIFSFFRISRVFRIARLTKILRLTRLVGITGKLQSRSKRLFHTNGLNYLIYVSIALILFSSMLYSLAENVSFMDSIWWALTTTTTVGYGDISPQTAIGRIAAIILMILGIGFIGMLTSSITSYFTNEPSNEKEDIKHLNDKIDILIEKIEHLESKLKD
ncbi:MULTISPECIES: potassium channel family protein [Lactobacillales]|uniref:potassium channel family protein n=1 Tax=Lactobacillales TaxID=186826 RepID=UPI002FC941F7